MALHHGKRLGYTPRQTVPLVVDNVSKQLSIRRALLRATRAHPQGGPARPTRATLHIRPSRSGHKRKTHPTVEPLWGSDAPGDKAAIHHILARSKPVRIKHGHRSTWVDEFLIRWEPEKFGEALENYRLGFDVVSITSKDAQVPSNSLQPFVVAKHFDRAHWRALHRPPLTTLCTVQLALSPQGPLHICSIKGGAQALDAFLVEEALASTAAAAPAKHEPRSPPIKWSLPAQAPTSNKRDTHSSPPSTSKEVTRDNILPPFPARQPRRPHNDLLKLVTVEGDPDRDSIPRPGPYTSLVPPTSPWNPHGKCMIGVYNHTGAAISPTLLSPERYKW